MAIHNWIQKADLQPASGEAPKPIALDETVIQADDNPLRLYAAVDPATNHTLHIRLFARRTITMMEIFLRELRQKYDVEQALFLVDGAPWLQTVLDHHGLDFCHETRGDRRAVEHIY